MCAYTYYALYYACASTKYVVVVRSLASTYLRGRPRFWRRSKRLDMVSKGYIEVFSNCLKDFGYSGRNLCSVESQSSTFRHLKKRGSPS